MCWKNDLIKESQWGTYSKIIYLWIISLLHFIYMNHLHAVLKVRNIIAVAFLPLCSSSILKCWKHFNYPCGQMTCVVKWPVWSNDPCGPLRELLPYQPAPQLTCTQWSTFSLWLPVWMKHCCECFTECRVMMLLSFLVEGKAAPVHHCGICCLKITQLSCDLSPVESFTDYYFFVNPNPNSLCNIHWHTHLSIYPLRCQEVAAEHLLSIAHTVAVLLMSLTVTQNEIFSDSPTAKFRTSD